MSIHIVISRTDNIGDVVLTLPLAGYLKEHFASIGGCRISFLGKAYTKDIIEACPYVDQFLNFDENLEKTLKDISPDWFFHIFPRKEIAKIVSKLKIPHSTGTLNRIFHWGRCRHLVWFSRKNSDLHESQLNFKLLKPLVGDFTPSLDKVKSYLTLKVEKPEIKNSTKDIIFHTLSNGSAVNWPFAYYRELARDLHAKNYRILLTGTAKEGEVIQREFAEELAQGVCLDQTGKFTMNELMSCIAGSFALVAASTGPLHLASALGIHAIGLYSQVRPLHSGRWKALGPHVHILEAKGEKGSPDISLITWQEVRDQITAIG